MSKDVFGVVLFLIVTILGCSTVTTEAQLSGSSRLDLSALPLPCSLVNEIKLDTPCEQTLLKFDIEALINLSLTVGGMVFSESLAISIAGLEHLILSLSAKLTDVTLKPEVWLAVPFETVIDFSGMANSAVIPPGDLLFVKQRLTLEANIFGLKVKNLAILEDVNFPDPGSDFDPLYYGPQSQSFAFGDIISISGRTLGGVYLSSDTGLCADWGSNSVKKYSASGRGNPDCLAKLGLKFDFETISVGGIEIGGIPLWQRLLRLSAPR